MGRLFGFVWFRFGFLELRSQSLNRCSIVRLNEERMGVIRVRRERRTRRRRKRSSGGGGVADDAMAMNAECARECGIMFLLMLSNGHNNCKLPALENLQLPPRHTHTHIYIRSTHAHTHTHRVLCGPKEKRNLLVIYFRLHGVKCTAAS